MLIRSSAVLTGKGEVLRDAAVLVRRDKIAAIIPAHEWPIDSDVPVIQLKGQVLSPGLINAHCHLDYTGMAGLLISGGFTKWIKSINALKRTFTSNDYINSIELGFKMLMESGVTTVANIEAFPELIPQLKPPPIRTWWFLELIDVRNRLHDEDSVLGMMHFFEEPPGWIGGFGLSPHSPYTASIELYRLAKRCSELYRMPFTTHIGESREEHEMFLYGRGELHDFLASLGRDCSDCGQGSSLSHLVEHRVLTQRCLAVHLNYLQEYDWPLLAETQASVVHCPKCHEYFGHAEFPLSRMRREGINVCLGTDSLASNNGLDMRSEIRQASISHPEVSPVEWWRMATINGARALGQSGLLGEIRVGAKADLVAFPLLENIDPFSSLIASRTPPTFMMVDGRRIA